MHRHSVKAHQERDQEETSDVARGVNPPFPLVHVSIAPFPSFYLHFSVFRRF
jgi:hypothetical protein